MSYVISSRFLNVDNRGKHVHALLDLYLAGNPIEDSPVAEWGRKVLAAGDWWYGIEKLPFNYREKGIQERQQKIIALYKRIKNNGYNGSLISIYFNKKSGQVHVYDGFHRLSILQYLKRETNMNCKISYHDKREEMKGDFPLADRIIEVNRREVLYQPCRDPRVKDWKLWRPDSQQRLEIVLNSLEPTLVTNFKILPNTILDVGCETGWFCRELSRRGYQVTGIDRNSKRLSIALYLNTIQNLDVKLIKGYWHIQLKDVTYDNIVMLSVLHHDVLACGVEQTLKRLETLRGKCKRLIIEFPLRADLVKWLPEEKKALWKFSLEEWIELLEKHTCMTVIDVQTAQLKDRPIIVMS